MARSTYSVAVISRLSDQRPIGEGIEKRGHLETYRVRLRWIVRMAWELLKKPKPDDEGPDWYREDREFDQVCALYRDEIVWLYNELGVISLVQGSLTDALGFLRQAYEFNEHIESRSHDGAIVHHINLNHAIVQLERGRLPSARSRLQLVHEATRERAWTLHHNAKGYLCVLDHITGRTDGLARRFRKVTDFFQKHNDSRAAAVFLNHRGRFLIGEDLDEAERCIEEARDMADTGGHEDLRHHIELSIIKLRLWKHQYLADKAPRLAQSKNLRELSAIEAYARRMGIWSLQCDALRIRAEFLLLQGETTTAGRLLIRSMAICRRNTMRLRLNNALTIYAKVLHHRGDLNSARRMARLSLNLARGMSYNLETPRVQELLRSLEHEA
jgi:tetratricopeptide (TPR) repeat protein